jgi:hypothetical protein
MRSHSSYDGYSFDQRSVADSLGGNASGRARGAVVHKLCQTIRTRILTGIPESMTLRLQGFVRRDDNVKRKLKGRNMRKGMWVLVDIRAHRPMARDSVTGSTIAGHHVDQFGA